MISFAYRYTVVLFLLLLCCSVNAQTISNYRTYYAYASAGSKQILVLRQFKKDAQDFFLTVDLYTLQTKIVAASTLSVKPVQFEMLEKLYAGTPYFRALSQARNTSLSLQNAGIVQGYPDEKGITLTIDLCPSHKPLDRVIFTSLINEFKKVEAPVPLALSLSGRFMLTHSADIKWLKSMEVAGELNITWINHTYNHHYTPNVPLQQNFLLKPGTDINFEILGTEIAMLEHGLTPSAFFRFPGLVSDQAVVDKVLSYGLIPVGSDAWLAKGQPANPSSIVLIHGNGNEPLGVKDFLQLLQSNRKAVLNKQWLLYDLRESLDDEFK
ncbi:polysaccharide deacetylase family protein [Mucilaginibacter auburnensis]|uniref:Polysaccharide deacetylase n=1 Tax=Mucilaginibacter auburnensis TaxID=1457233 RepID=A0A2H9VLL7_9SPHI|nr:polysaccharide deacetylase [Mucilaginibacter auburnensis]PJJ79239.1 hypothetical protein CLV57_2365 [Mucilaginibacter auburnensis]